MELMAAKRRAAAGSESMGMMMQGYEWELEWLGEPGCYPGHPLVVATMVMDRYQSLEHAKQRREGKSYCNALSDGFVSGAGCAVSSALDVLEFALRGELDRALAHAQRYWEGWEAQSTANPEKGKKGRAQADMIKPAFMQRLEAWKSGNLVESKYRLKEELQDA